MANQENTPEATIRAGGVKAVIWKNLSEGGKEYFTITLSRTYKDGDDWKETNSYGRDDLVKARLVLDKTIEALFLKVTPEITQEGFRGKLTNEKKSAQIG